MGEEQMRACSVWHEPESGDVRATMDGESWRVSVWLQQSDVSGSRVMARCEWVTPGGAGSDHYDVLEARVFRVSVRGALRALCQRVDGATADATRVVGPDTPDRRDMILLMREIEAYTRSPECSVCRRRHGAEVEHAAE